MRRTFGIGLATALMVGALVILPIQAQAAEGWVTENGKTYYYVSDDDYFYGGIFDVNDDGKEYYFDEDGVLQKGWIEEPYVDDEGNSYTSTLYADPTTGELAVGWKTIDGKKYYFDGAMYYDGIYDIDGKEYFFNEKGVLQTGWFEETYEYDDGESNTMTYYADPESGVLANGWKKLSGKWYYFEPEMYSGWWYTINGKDYFFNNDGVLQTGWFQDDNKDEWFYSNSDGVLKSGWQKINKKWYYLDPEGYYMYDDGTWKIKGKYYFFDKNGVMKTGWCKSSYEDEGGTYTEWYYANTNGELAVGWKKVKNKWYYFDPEWPEMVTGGRVIDGVLYTFDKNGALSSTINTTGWKKVDGNWFYIDSNKKPVIKSWKKLNGKWYYFGSDGIMYDTGHYYIDKKYYFFNANGSLVSKAGWQKETYTHNKKTYTNWFYVNSNGTCVTNAWKKIGGKWYYFEEDAYMADYESYWINGKAYSFNANGSMRTGWVKFEVYDTGWYYFGKNGAMLTNGWVKDSKGWCWMDAEGNQTKSEMITYKGKNYYLKSNGYMAANETVAWDGNNYKADKDGVCTLVQ